MVPLLAWLVVAILAFNLAFVAFRLWATRERPLALASRPRAIPAAYATILAKEYPHRTDRAHGHHFPRH